MPTVAEMMAAQRAERQAERQARPTRYQRRIAAQRMPPATPVKPWMPAAAKPIKPPEPSPLPLPRAQPPELGAAPPTLAGTPPTLEPATPYTGRRKRPPVFTTDDAGAALLTKG